MKLIAAILLLIAVILTPQFSQAGVFGSSLGMWKKSGFSLDFTKGALPSGVTFSRASLGTYFNNSGLMVTATTDVPRFDYDPSTLATRGILIEPQATNYVLNNSMSGAAVGSLPTSWQLNGTGGGVVASVVGTGTENGINYIDVTFAGTTTGSNTTDNIGSLGIGMTSTTSVPATLGVQNYMGSYLRLVGGSLSNVNINYVVRERNSSGSTTGTVTRTSLASLNSLITASSLSAGYIKDSYTPVNSSVYYVVPQIMPTWATSGLVINVTLRIGMPQAEASALSTSTIPTTTSSVTRAADVLSFTIPSGITALIYTFDDGSTQKVTGLSSGTYTVPTMLNRFWIKTIVGSAN